MKLGKLSIFLTLHLYCAATIAACTVADIEILSVKAKVVDKCRTRSCAHIQGAASLRNKCSEAVGVLVKMSAYDKKDGLVATAERWPASIRNIPPGTFEFSLDLWLDYDPSMHSFALLPVQVKRW